MSWILGFTTIGLLVVAASLWMQHICDIDIDSLDLGFFEKDICFVQ